ncbi:hypothetical protein MRB53_035859 [Persea americana]|uniref:Uncharacterized protein n=1 Tax=Persea americana TaxID=3435 RepID=A0ACC2K698_PERAE|nr:hypothetical protein MRB53_035859 [Persea americana]|eukprot:TRINITY_DN5337_c0_g1_i1.p1 TRINITY_DN5337_c0_g1~~TRINITY_DN5337_c0_g1_i1.p1  ORF type:complete len:173 (-),score=25.54 TRINITY_DN5337_c0_g1_i1:136-654(-)
MKDTIRCCISCILPCGVLDVIRIVHSNGRVEELSKTVRAGEIMKANPKHVLRKSSMSSSSEGVVPKIVILPPDAELQRGKIYFLMPVSSLPEKTRSASTRKKKKREAQNNHNINTTSNGSSVGVTKLLVSDHYLSEILSEKISTQRDRRRGRVGVWRPHLESISEISNANDL